MKIAARLVSLAFASLLLLPAGEAAYAQKRTEGSFQIPQIEKKKQTRKRHRTPRTKAAVQASPTPAIAATPPVRPGTESATPATPASDEPQQLPQGQSAPLPTPDPTEPSAPAPETAPAPTTSSQPAKPEQPKEELPSATEAPLPTEKPATEPQELPGSREAPLPSPDPTEPAPATEPAPVPAPPPAEAKPEAATKAQPAIMPETEKACRARLKGLGAEFEDRPAEGDTEAGCSMPFPLLLTHLTKDVKVEPGALLNCATAEAAATFTISTLQPLSREVMKSDLVSLSQASAYVCRPRHGTNKLSEHAFGNALDIGSFSFADKTELSVSPVPGNKGEEFLREVRKRACGPFKTVLGPGSDADHATHLHLDLAERKNGGTFCQ